MRIVRKAAERGRANFGWLDSRHTFSFGTYLDARWLGFGPLRVINDDRVAPGGGFPTHPHDNMEIVSYVLDGALAHRDSIGTGSIIRPGEVQRMSAGTGIRHSEFNASKEEPVHFLQIWIIPESDGLPPSYEQKLYPDAEKADRWRLVGSRDGRDGSVVIHRDLDLYASRPGPGVSIAHDFAPGRMAWIHIARGEARVDGETLSEGDAVGLTDARSVVVEGLSADAEALLFDMAA